MYVIGLDIGTTGAKAIVTDKDGHIYGEGYKEYGFTKADGTCFEQSAVDWYDGAVYAVRKACLNVDKGKISALSLSTQGASMLAVGKDFNPLCNAITWMDKRAALENELLVNKIGSQRLYEKSGWEPSPMLDAAKILWLRNSQAEIFRNAYSFVSTLEYMNYMLTGRNVSDPSNSAIRCLTDIRMGTYDPEILSVLGIDEKRLPKIMPTGSLVGTLAKKAAEGLGLSQKVKVYNGAHDQYCASLGSGAVAKGDMLIATGTTWVLLGVTDALLYTKSRISPGIHPISGLYGAMISFLGSGSALKWLSGIIGESYNEIDKNAALCRESAANLYFMPFLSGGGFPYGMGLKSFLHGLSISHGKFDIALALMEGAAFETKTALKEFTDHGIEIKHLYMAGRAAQSDLWRGLVRDVTGYSIILSKTKDTSCMGAAAIAAAGCGLHDSLASAVKSMSRTLPPESPDSKAQEFYAEKYESYNKLKASFLNTRWLT